MPNDDSNIIAGVAQPTAKVVLSKNLCLRFHGSDCTRCVTACPHDAISLDDDGTPCVANDNCNGCGLCYGICDAFSSTHLTLNDLHSRIQRIALGGDRVYLTCRENIFDDFAPASNVIVVPCLSIVPPELWTLILAENIRISLACDLSYCDECARAGAIGGMLFPRAIEIAERQSGGKVGFVTEIPEDRTLLEQYSSDDQLGRRAAFTSLGRDLGDIASGKRRLKQSNVLQEFHEKRERMRAASLLNFDEDHPLNTFHARFGSDELLYPRRKYLLEAITRTPAIARDIDIDISDTDVTTCTGEGRCIDVCPTGARTLDDLTEQPIVEAVLCIGCGLCVDACPTLSCEIISTSADVFGIVDPEETDVKR